MKSIIEEASSIFKAIEKGWSRAGKPEEFSVKIYEEPEHNFLGLTTKSAKIAIFYENNEKINDHNLEQKKNSSKSQNQKLTQNLAQANQLEKNSRAQAQQNINTVQTAKPKARRILEEKPNQEKNSEKNKQQAFANRFSENKPQNQLKEEKANSETKKISRANKSEQPWSPDLINSVKTYLDDTLKMLDITDKYELEANHLYLKIIFDGIVFNDAQRQKQLFSSLAMLIIQMLKKKFKRPLKGYKLILQNKE